MNYTYSTEEDVILIILLVILVSFAVLAIYFNSIAPLLGDREYIKMEMRRSETKGEYRYWKRELKRLYLRHIPIIGRFFND